MTNCYHPIEKEALAIVFQSPTKITPAILSKILSQKFLLNKREVRSIIKDLIQREALTYTYQHGCTFIERSFEKPTLVSDNIILLPPNRHYQPKSRDVVIKIMGGASFGTGEHSTTRLSLKCLEYLLIRLESGSHIRGACLDIGTGSGILVIAAVKLGIPTGLGLDIDPNAVSEAASNVALNNLDDRVIIKNTPVECVTKGPFSLITANLRYPSLIRLIPEICRLSENNGWVVLSGFRLNELPDILKRYGCKGFELIRMEEEKKWGCILLRKIAI